MKKKRRFKKNRQSNSKGKLIVTPEYSERVNLSPELSNKTQEMYELLEKNGYPDFSDDKN